MKKSYLALLVSIIFIVTTAGLSFAAMGEMGLKSKDISVNFFGSLKTYPVIMQDFDFNDDDTARDFTIDESGKGADHYVRNEFRMGWAGKGENWSFLAILESEFTLDKYNGDRGGDQAHGDIMDMGMTGEDFGVEKLDFTYNFGPFILETGWNTKFLDIKTGGLVYGDDHPYIGLKGKIGDIGSWEALYLIIQEDMDPGIDADSGDWKCYTLKGIFNVGDMKISPFYAFSDNRDSGKAQSHYFGVEGYGKIGMFTPRFEAVYVDGEQDDTDMDIQGFAAFASLEMNISKAFNPYIGGTFRSGDDDANDDDIDAFNSITNITRYTPTFGMENSMINLYNTTLGSHLYANDFDMLGGGGSGYGGISNSAGANSPGLITLGLGCKGTIDKWSYKTQLQYFMFEDEGALEDYYGVKIDDEVGLQFDVSATYKFSNHFSLGNTFSVFDPGDAIEDIYGDDNEDIALLNTIEMIWKW